MKRVVLMENLVKIGWKVNIIVGALLTCQNFCSCSACSFDVACNDNVSFKRKDTNYSYLLYSF